MEHDDVPRLAVRAPLRSQEPAHKVQLYLGPATIQQTLGTYYHATIGNQGE